MENIIKLITRYYYVFLKGLGGTMWLAAVTVLCGTVLGLFTALVRMSKIKPLSALGRIYIEILRGTPILLQLYFFVFGLPKLIPLDLSETLCTTLALTVNSSAYIAEVIRAGINAVDIGQWEAARSLGLSNFNMMRKVILPQAVKNILPALGNEFIVMVKETSLASVFFVGELMTSYKTIQSTTFLTIPTLTIVGLIYLTLNYILSAGVSALERRMATSD